jgi:hypothetical protein
MIAEQRRDSTRDSGVKTNRSTDWRDLDIHSSRRSRPFQELPCHHHPLDLVGAWQIWVMSGGHVADLR